MGCGDPKPVAGGDEWQWVLSLRLACLEGSGDPRSVFCCVPVTGLLPSLLSRRFRSCPGVRSPDAGGWVGQSAGWKGSLLDFQLVGLPSPAAGTLPRLEGRGSAGCGVRSREQMARTKCSCGRQGSGSLGAEAQGRLLHTHGRPPPSVHQVPAF